MLTKQTNLHYAYRQHCVSKPGISMNDIGNFLTRVSNEPTLYAQYKCEDVKTKGLTAKL